MIVQLLTQQSSHAAGTSHPVVEVIPHGGNYDDPWQYLLADGTHVPSGRAQVDLTAFGDWLSDQQRDDPVGFETKAGEGWTEGNWLQKFLEEEEAL